MIGVVCGIGRRLNATNLECRNTKELEDFPARRIRDWTKISVVMTIGRQAYQLYINEKRILRSIFLVQTIRSVGAGWGRRGMGAGTGEWLVYLLTVVVNVMATLFMYFTGFLLDTLIAQDRSSSIVYCFLFGRPTSSKLGWDTDYFWPRLLVLLLSPSTPMQV